MRTSLNPQRPYNFQGYNAPEASLTDPNANWLQEGNQAPLFNMNLNRASNISTPSLNQAVGGISGAIGLYNTISNNLNTPEVNQVNFSALNDRNTLSSEASSLEQQGGYDIGRTSNEGSALSGAASGASLGTAILPGIGTAVGGALGAIGGFFSSMFGNNKRRDAEREANREAVGQINNQNYNINNKDIRYALANRLAKGGNIRHLRGIESLLARNGNNIYAYGGQFSNGVTQFNEGGTHEENPLGGIPQGIGPNGEPNLVEEGEVKWNDYIFSDRLKVPKDVKEALLPSTLKNKTFADAAKSLSEESKERELDPISRRGLNVNLSRLAILQEMSRPQEEGNTYPDGGRLSYSDWLSNNNLQESEDYNLRGAYDAGYDPDEQGHLPTVDNRTGIFLKRKDHPTINKELEWFNSDTPEAIEFRTNHYLDDSGDYYRYIQIAPMNNNEMAKGGSMIKPENRGKFTAWAKRHNMSVAEATSHVLANEDRYPESTRKMAQFSRNIGGHAEGGALRYSPLISNALLLGNSITSTPERLNLGRVNPTTINNRVTYEPIDTDYIVNQSRQASSALNRNIIGTSGGNRAIAQSGLLAANRSSQNSIGDAFFRAREFNNQRRMQVEDFNRGTDQYNAGARTQAQAQNTAFLNQERLYDAQSQATRRNELRQGVSVLGTQLGQVGTENRWVDVARNIGGGYDALGRWTGNSSALGGKIYKNKIK